MEFQKLNAEVRAGRKKGTARKLRRSGSIPAVCYGLGSEPLTLSLDPKALTDTLRANLGRNTVLELTVSGEGAPKEPMLVMLQDTQYHPVEREMLHADFLRVSKDRHVQVGVPLNIIGKSIGIQAGGVLAQVYRELPLSCPLDQIPTELTLDVTNVDVGEILKVSDLTLPENTTIALDPAQTLLTVNLPSVQATAEEEEGEEGEVGEAGAETEEGAPEKEGE